MTALYFRLTSVMTRGDYIKAECANVIPDYEIESLARCLLPKIQAYFDTPEGQAAFEQWKREKNVHEK